MNEASFFHIPWEGNEFTEPDQAKVDEARSALMALGQYRWGKPDLNTLERIDRLGDLDHLDALIKRAFQFSSWEDLVSSTPPAKLRGWWEDSSFYHMVREKWQAKCFLAERIEEARRILLRQGGRRFGRPDPAIQSVIEATDSIDRIEGWLDRVINVSSWDELLSEPPKGG